MGSVVSPGRGSKRAAHMLLLRSNCTTCKMWWTLRGWRSPGSPHCRGLLWGARDYLGPGNGGVHEEETLWGPALQGKGSGQLSLLSLEQRLTPTRPNSQARSSGVLPELSTMQGLDWCCSSISDYGWVRVPSARTDPHCPTLTCTPHLSHTRTFPMIPTDQELILSWALHPPTCTPQCHTRTHPGLCLPHRSGRAGPPGAGGCDPHLKGR